MSTFQFSADFMPSRMWLEREKRRNELFLLSLFIFNLSISATTFASHHNCAHDTLVEQVIITQSLKQYTAAAPKQIIDRNKRKRKWRPCEPNVQFRIVRNVSVPMQFSFGVNAKLHFYFCPNTSFRVRTNNDECVDDSAIANRKRRLIAARDRNTHSQTVILF